MRARTPVLPFGDEAIAEAARIIADGGVVAVPTETVYGLAGDATSDVAVAAIYTAKRRPSFNPLIVHVRDLEHALEFGDFFSPSPSGEGLGWGSLFHLEASPGEAAFPTPTPPLKGRGLSALDLAAAHWPGPLTIVVPLRPDAAIAKLATAGLVTIALRVPAHRAMQALLRATGRPLAAPSANASGTISPTRAEHVLRSLNSRIPLIVDDGATPGGIESTIVTVENGQVRLLRPGPIDVTGASTATSGKVEAPGQLAAHYAPSKPLRLNAQSKRDGETLIGFGPVAGDASLSPSGDTTEAAARLFDLLHAADAGLVSRIAVAPVPEVGLGVAINDRLRRAAAGSPKECAQ